MPFETLLLSQEHFESIYINKIYEILYIHDSWGLFWQLAGVISMQKTTQADISNGPQMELPE